MFSAYNKRKNGDSKTRGDTGREGERGSERPPDARGGWILLFKERPRAASRPRGGAAAGQGNQTGVLLLTLSSVAEK